MAMTARTCSFATRDRRWTTIEEALRGLFAGLPAAILYA
jgi:hypothetical protein